MATKSLFFQLTEKYLEGIIGRIIDKYNDEYQQQTYLHLTMLQEEYSADLIWSSAEFQNNIVAADVVSMDSSLPLKKRDTLSTAVGRIPKVGIKFSRGEKFLSDIAVMSARGAREAEVAAKVLNDVSRAINGIIVRTEILFQQGLSTGVILVEDADTPGLGVRADFGYKEKNFFATTHGAWGESTATPLDDIHQLFDEAQADGNSIGLVMLSKNYFNKLRNSTQAKQLAATFAGQVIVSLDNLMTPSREVMLNALADEFGAQFRIVDSSFRVEEKDGTTKNVKPWADANVVALPSENVGRLVYGSLAEESRPVNDVTYVKAGSHILVAEFGETDPLREFTSAQSLCLPVIDNAQSIYVLEADKGPISLDPSSLEFSAAGATKTVAASSVNEGDISVSVPETDASWLSAAISDGTISVTAAANNGSGATAREGTVKVEDAAGNKAEIAVSQAA
jgi:hypothetical protein